MTFTAPMSETVEGDVASVIAAADLTTPLGEAPFAGVITEVEYFATATLTGANTESRTCALFNRGQAGAGSTKAAEKAFTSGVNAPANDSTAITLSGTPANLVVAEGDVLDWESLHIGGTGLADPGGLVKVTISRT